MMIGHSTGQSSRREHGGRWQRSLVWLLAVVITISLLLAGCGVNSGAGTPTGMLVGRVIAAPTCPIEPAGKSCPPASVPHRQITIDTPDGRLFETITTDAGGHFSATLPAGSYVLHVAIQPGTIGMRQITPGAVTITAGQTITLTIELDTGIR